jgi:hypothetical protein
MPTRWKSLIAAIRTSEILTLTTCWEPTGLYNKSTTQKLILHSQSTPTKYQKKLDSQAITIELQPLSQKPTKTRSSIGINRLDQTAQQRNYPVNLGTLGCHPCAINKNEISVSIKQLDQTAQQKNQRLLHLASHHLSTSSAMREDLQKQQTEFRTQI